VRAVLLSTAAGRSGAARTIRWAPIAVVPVVSSVGVLLAPERAVDVLGEAGLVLTAATLAFVADDLAAGPAPATPVGLRAQLAGRAALVTPAVALGWAAVVVSAGDALGSLPTRAAVAVAVAAVSTAVALVVGRRWRVPAAGGAGFAVVLAGQAVVAPVAPAAWLEALPPAPVTAVAAIAAAAAALAVATREPA
jgi:hypothetical protein